MSRKSWARMVAAGLGLAVAASTGPAVTQMASAAPARVAVAAPSSFAEEFASPSMAEKPKMRWWVPNALMTKAEITREIEGMVAAGFGGAEVVSFEKADTTGVDVSWGSQRWNELTKHMLHVAGQLDFTIDFTLTAGWPLNLPTITDIDDPAQGAQMEADGAHVDGITQAAPYSGAVPVPTFRDAAGTPDLVAVTVAKYADKATKTLDYASAQALDLETVTFPDRANDPTKATVSFTPGDAGEYVLFGWWEYPSGKKAHGNYEIDHYGKTGAQALIDFWEDRLIPAYGEDWENVGALFSDSLEFETHLDWTEGLLDGFEDYAGYDLAAYLPGVYQASSVGNYQANPAPDFTFGARSAQVRNDFHRYLTHLYVENHLKPLNDFAHANGVQLRAQPGYGKNLDMAESAQHVDIPETESLYGDDLIDFYRLQAGAVHLTDKEIYSTETAPELHLKLNFGGFEYNILRGNGEEDSGKNQQTWRDMLWHIQRAFSGGVNQVVFHGYSYNGQYDGAGSVDGFASDVTWPGWEAMDFSNSWGERSPSWKDAPAFTSWVARNQQILREGTAKMDLAIYSLKYWENIDIANRTTDYEDGGALEQTGYSYDFVAPSGFALANAQVQGRRLDPEGPAYKAIIVDTESSMPAETVARFGEYADRGLPIVFVGDLPTSASYTSDADIADAVTDLLAEPSVVQVADTAAVPGALTELGVSPDASYQAPAKLLSYHRQAADADLYHFYNYGDADTWPAAKVMDEVNTTVTLQGEGRPYLLDAWTGEITPVAEFQQHNGSVTLDLNVGANDSAIVALAKDGFGAAAPTISVPDTTLDVEYDHAGNVVAKSKAAGTVPVTLSDGRTVSAAFGAVPAARTLDTWELNVEKWTKGATPGQSARSTVDIGTLDELKPWKQIEGLDTASGVGTYTTELELAAGWAAGVGAVLDLGEVTDSYELTVNGTIVTGNQNDPRVDVGPYLKAGRNTIVVDVATTLFNAWVDEYDLAKKTTDYGLMGPVTLTPYRWVTLPKPTTPTPPKPTPPATKINTATKLKVAPRVLRAGKRAKAVIRVNTIRSSAVAKGKVRIFIDGKNRGAVRLRGGKATIRLPKLRVGPHRIRAKYLGSTTTRKSTSSHIRVRVVKRR